MTFFFYLSHFFGPQKCASKSADNIILSPYSIEAALSLATQGADGESFNVLRNGLHLTGSREEIADEYGRQLAGVTKSIGAATLSVANKVFVQENYSIKKSFRDVAVNKYGSEVESVNFSQNEQAAATINKWVEDKTHDKIKNLISADSLSSDSRLILVNAIYFKGPWEKKFDPQLTADDDFWVSKEVSKKIQFMNKKDDFLYGVFPEYNCTALLLKYNNSEFSFLILLPNERDGLPQLEAKLDTINLNELSQKLYKQEVNVKIPKMKIESSFNLKEVLSEVGDRFNWVASTSTADLNYHFLSWYWTFSSTFFSWAWEISSLEQLISPVFWILANHWWSMMLSTRHSSRSMRKVPKQLPLLVSSTSINSTLVYALYAHKMFFSDR